MTKRAGIWLVALALIALPQLAGAQTSGTIAGVVKDASGAVLPGATVEAASPALIEKVRVSVTDGQGNYKIIDLRPGVYTVTVTMPGFGTYKREGLDLSAGVTANVAAELKVGSLEETVTVTGATPIVDVQSARTQNVMKSETLDSLPSGSRNLMAFASMTLGAMPSSGGRNDVGGDKGEQASGIILHGGRGDDGRVNWDGMSTNVFFGGGGGQQRTYYFNTIAVQEVVVDTAGATADTETGGANINMVPREGGNSIKVYSNLAFTNESLSAESVPKSVSDRGFAAQSSLRKIWDYGVGVGGPIKQDKAWFYATYRNWGAQNFGNVKEDADPNPLVYTPGANRAFANTYFADESFRVTWQLTQKHKINQEFHLQYGCSCDLGIGGGQLATSEAATDFNYGPQVLNQTTWNWTASNKLLVQAGASFLRQEVNFMNVGTRNKFTGKGTNVFPGAGTYAITELATGFSYAALPGGFTSYGVNDNSNNFNQKVSVNYITGSHAMKFGLQTVQGKYDIFGMQGGVEQVNFRVLNGVPVGLRLFAGPFQSLMDLRGQGLFAQDHPGRHVPSRVQRDRAEEPAELQGRHLSDGRRV
jgi:Carboxypeptidase regulatory-like domain